MSKLSYRPEIDGLRAVAVMAVVFFHFGLGCQGGFVGVDVFFVISGFLITKIIYRDIEASTFSLKNFWIRRVRRIAPAMIVMSVVTLVVGLWLIYPSDLKGFGKTFIFQVIMLSNFYFYKKDGYFDAPSEHEPLLHTWSLSIEEQFYLIFPLAFAWLCRKRSKKYVVRAVCAVLVLSLIISIVFTKPYANASFFLLPARMWEFLIGSILAICTVRINHKFWQEIISAVGMVLILFSVIYFSDETVFPGIWAAVPCLGAAFIIVSNSSDKTIVGKILSCSPFVFVGKISYSLYLWHWPLVTYVKYSSYTGYTAGLAWLLVVVSFLLAYLSWRYIETPFRRMSLLKTNRKLIKSYCICSVVLLICGFVAYKGKGLEFRFGREVLAVLEPHHIDLGITKYSPEIASSKELALLETGEGNEIKPILVWGDSHAESMMPAFYAVAKNRDINIYTAFYGGYPPLINVRTTENPDLLEVSDSIVKLIREKKITDCFLVSRWSLYPEGSPGKNYKNAIYNDSSRSSREVFESSLDATVTKLLNLGVSVWIVKQVPEQSHHGSYAIANAMRFNDRDVDWSGISVSVDDHEEKQAWVNSMIDKLGGNENIHIIDPSSYFQFGSEHCYIAVDGFPLYVDKDHITEKGALLLKKPIGDAFDKILTP